MLGKPNPAGCGPSLALGARIEKLREAETILIELANAMPDDDTAPKESKTEAIQRVVDLYEAWHTAEPDADLDSTGGTPLPRKAAQWRAKLNALITITRPATSQPAR